MSSQPFGHITRMKRNQISWWLWAVGTVLIALSWFDVVSTTIGWCGFGIGIVGSVLGWGLRPPQSAPPPEPDAPKSKQKGGNDVA
jgi:heme/copper-type cytochrome/quinol oxidase subunit 1